MIPSLYQSPVRFIENRAEDLHTYLLDFKELVGVTTLLNETLFKDKYNGISKDVLTNAANRGTAIHEAIQAYELGQDFTLPDDLTAYQSDAKKAVKIWAAYRSDEGKKYSDLITACSEYLVSNEQDLATKIDLVLYNGKWWIGDIKTTSKLDKEYLSWQLSVEAYFFERQTGEKIAGLLAMWFDRKSGKWLWIEVERKSDEEIEKLIQMWRELRSGAVPFELAVKEEKELPAELVSLGKTLSEYEHKINALKAEQEEFRAKVLAEMKARGITQIKTDDCTISYVEATKKKTFNKDIALKKYPDLEKLVGIYKISDVKETIKITIKK